MTKLTIITTIFAAAACACSDGGDGSPATTSAPEVAEPVSDGGAECGIHETWVWPIACTDAGCVLTDAAGGAHFN